MHPMILCSINAESILKAIFAAVKQERWVLQGHESFRDSPTLDNEHGDNGVDLDSYYGSAKTGGGFILSLSSDLDPQDRAAEKDMDHDSDQVQLRFVFFHDGKKVSEVVFIYDLNRPRWWVDHFYLAELEGAEKYAMTKLLERMGRDPADDEEPISDDQKAMEMIAAAADYTFENCNK
jgi:hypothetical protein